MKTYLLRIALSAIFFASVMGCATLQDAVSSTPNTEVPGGAPTGATNTAAAAAGVPQWGVRTKTSGCQVRGPLADPACTPGDIFPNVTKDQVCASGYSSSVRDVPTSVKNAVYAEYGVTHHSTGEYEVDHYVSLELGGSNDISNLFPEAAAPQPGFHEKDKVENYLHAQVCNGSVTLANAQREIATNWLAVYNQMPTK